MHWGTLVKSWFSLYRAVAGGNGWAKCYYALNNPPGQYRPPPFWLYLTVVASAVWDASSEDAIFEEPCPRALRSFF